MSNNTFWQDLFNGKGAFLFLGVGLLPIFFNVLVLVGIDTHPNVWLYYLDIRYWSANMSMVLWITAIWLILESMEGVEDYLPFIRVSSVIGISLAVFFALRSFFSNPVDLIEHALWLNIALVIVVCCVVRSLFLLYDYRYNGKDSIDSEEAQWFWGLSGFGFAGLVIFAMMCVIPVKIPIHAGMDGFASESLFANLRDGFRNLLQTGRGTVVLRVFALLTFVASLAFVYVAGKWILIFLSRFRRE